MAGYSIRGARGLTQRAIAHLLQTTQDLTNVERRKPASTFPHAFRHTVGTQMLACGVALEVVRRPISRTSLGTAAIYVSPEEAWMRREAAKYDVRFACRTCVMRIGLLLGRRCVRTRSADCGRCMRVEHCRTRQGGVKPPGSNPVFSSFSRIAVAEWLTGSATCHVGSRGRFAAC